MGTRLLVLAGVIAAIVILAVALVVAIGDSDSPPSAIAMVEDSAANASEVTSYRFQIEATQIEDGEVITALTTGEAIADGLHVRTIASDSPDEESIYVGGKGYYRASDGPWEVSDVPSQCWTCSLSSEMGQLVDTLVDVEIVGEEEVNGVLTVHIKGSTDMAEKAKQLWPYYDTATPEERESWEGPREQFLAGEEHMDLWLDEEERLLRQMKVQASFPAIADLEPYSFDATFSYWDYNAEIVIEAPVVP
jgi:hypothetical protein